MDLNQEKELIKRAQKNPQAFGEIFDKYHQIIFGYVLRRTANVETARDIAAETFLKAFSNLWKFKWQGISISSWLYRIASNEIINFFRKKHYNTESLDELREIYGFDPAGSQNLAAEIIAAQDELKRHQDFLQIQKLLLRLPEKYQQAIALRYFESMSIKEVAGILNKNEGTVKSLISRGLEKLRVLSKN